MAEWLMEANVGVQVVLEAMRRQPFVPFTIALADGRSLAVTHPEAVAVGRRRVVVVAPDDSTTIIEPLLIVSLDYNGARRKGRRP